MPLLTSPSNSQVWNILEFLNPREEKLRGQDGSGIPVAPLAVAEGRRRFSSHPRGSMTGKAGVGRAVSLKKRGAWAHVSFKPKFCNTSPDSLGKRVQSDLWSHPRDRRHLFAWTLSRDSSPPLSSYGAVEALPSEPHLPALPEIHRSVRVSSRLLAAEPITFSTTDLVTETCRSSSSNARGEYSGRPHVGGSYD